MNVSYKILESTENGQLLGKTMEESSDWMRNCCKSSRSFNSTVIDGSDDVIFRIERPYRSSFCGIAAMPGMNLINMFPGLNILNLFTSYVFPQEINITDASHTKIIEVKQTGSWTNLNIEIRNIHTNSKLSLSKNFITASLPSFCDVVCGETVLQVLDDNKNLVAEIVKEHRGCCTEFYSPCDTIIVKFMDLVDSVEDNNNNDGMSISTTNFGSSVTRTPLQKESSNNISKKMSGISRKTSTFIHGSHGSSLCTWDKIGILGAAILVDMHCWEYNYDQDGLCEECAFTKRNKAMRFAAKNFIKFNSFANSK